MTHTTHPQVTTPATPYEYESPASTRRRLAREEAAYLQGWAAHQLHLVTWERRQAATEQVTMANRERAARATRQRPIVDNRDQLVSLATITEQARPLDVREHRYVITGSPVIVAADEFFADTTAGTSWPDTAREPRGEMPPSYHVNRGEWRRTVAPGATEQVVSLDRHDDATARLASQLADALTGTTRFGRTRCRVVVRDAHRNTARNVKRAAAAELKPAGLGIRAAWQALHDGTATAVLLSGGGTLARDGEQVTLSWAATPFAARSWASRATVERWHKATADTYRAARCEAEAFAAGLLSLVGSSGAELLRAAREQGTD